MKKNLCFRKSTEASHGWREVRFTDNTVREAEQIRDGVKAKQGIKNVQLIKGQKGVTHVYMLLLFNATTQNTSLLHSR